MIPFPWSPRYNRAHLWALAVVVVGALTGYSADKLPVAPLVREAIAMVLTWNLGVQVMGVAFRVLSPDAGEAGGGASPVREIVVATLLAAAVATVAHYVMPDKIFGDADPVLRPRMAFLGFAGAVAGSLQAWLSRSLDKDESEDSGSDDLNPKSSE